MNAAISPGRNWINLTSHLDENRQRLVNLKITDNGGGMEESIGAHIFKLFCTTKFTGSGLGLAAIQGLVTAHKGQISVDSFPDQGATCTLTLPGS